MIQFPVSRLKKVRIAVSLLILFPVSLLFLDPWNALPVTATTWIASSQLVPALMKILTRVSLTVIGLLLILGMTILFGRIYCSSLCPLGTFQDIIIRLGRSLEKRKRFHYRKPPLLLHYSLLGLVTTLALLGSMTLLNLLEPFSNYGRILSNAIGPIITLANNVAADLLNRSSIYLLYNIPLRPPSLDILAGVTFFLLLVGTMAFSRGRLFCNLLCPAGALIGLLSRLSLYKITIDGKTCNECGACEKMCKAECIESNSGHIEFSACIGCFNCLAACPTESINYRRIVKSRSERARAERSRRIFFRQLLSPLPGMALLGASDTTRPPQPSYEETRNFPVTPPGSQGIDHFTSTCTACHLCVSECPAKVLYPSFLDYGIAGIFQPKMNYDASYCNYECNVCSRICPSGAIAMVLPEEKKLIQIGRATFVKDDCVVVTKKKDCAACSEHCPTKAVTMVPYEGKLLIPELTNDICVGCGACEHACPTTPRKAIYVTANRVHLEAKKPPVKKGEPLFESTKEFPF